MICLQVRVQGKSAASGAAKNEIYLWDRKDAFTFIHSAMDRLVTAEMHRAIRPLTNVAINDTIINYASMLLESQVSQLRLFFSVTPITHISLDPNAFFAWDEEVDEDLADLPELGDGEDWDGLAIHWIDPLQKLLGPEE